MRPIYFDHNATTPLDSSVLEAMLPYLKEEFGNASTVYQLGQRARKAVEDARAHVARVIGAEDPEEIVFTSGATEANNMAIKGAVDANPEKKRRVVSTAIEHSSVRNVLSFLAEKGQIDSVPAPVQANGLVNPDDVSQAITPDTALVSVMAVNNETGTIQPIVEISKICQKKKVLFHVDAAQALGKIPINVNEWGVDLLSASAHKFGGPKGVGFLYIRKGTRLSSLIQGGTHEKNRRGGTENVPNIVGLGRACELVLKNLSAKNRTIKDLRDHLENSILTSVSHTFVNGDKDSRVSNTTNICFDYTDSTGLIMALDLKGVACSNGSACATGSVQASHVLLAMGLPQDKAHASLRFSLGATTTKEDIDQALPLIKASVEKLRQTHPLWKEAVNH